MCQWGIRAPFFLCRVCCMARVLCMPWLPANTGLLSKAFSPSTPGHRPARRPRQTSSIRATTCLRRVHPCRPFPLFPASVQFHPAPLAAPRPRALSSGRPPYTSTPSLQLVRPIATHRMHHCPSAPTFGGVLTSSWPARSLAVGPASPRPAGPYRASSASSTLCTSGLPHQALPTPRRLPAAEAYNTTALDTYTGAFSRPRLGPEVTRPLNKHSADHLLGPPHLRAQVVGRHICCLPTCM